VGDSRALRMLEDAGVKFIARGKSGGPESGCGSSRHVARAAVRATLPLRPAAITQIPAAGRKPLVVPAGGFWLSATGGLLPSLLRLAAHPIPVAGRRSPRLGDPRWGLLC
jgi:hypothetical protein